MAGLSGFGRFGGILTAPMEFSAKRGKTNLHHPRRTRNRLPSNHPDQTPSHPNNRLSMKPCAIQTAGLVAVGAECRGVLGGGPRVFSPLAMSGVMAGRGLVVGWVAVLCLDGFTNPHNYAARALLLT